MKIKIKILADFVTVREEKLAEELALVFKIRKSKDCFGRYWFIFRKNAEVDVRSYKKFKQVFRVLTILQELNKKFSFSATNSS